MKPLCVVSFLLIPMFSTPSTLHAGSDRITRLDNPAGLPSQSLININRIAAWYDDNGVQEENTALSEAGLTYPRGTATAVFSSGLIWGGIFHDGTLPEERVNGQSYSVGTRPGAILGIRTGLSEDPTSPDVRVWRIRRDYLTADLRQDAAEINNVAPEDVTSTMIEAVRAQYAADWEGWPWMKGAPFYDLNENSIRDSGEEPGLAGADQVLWFVCNDLDVEQPWTNIGSGIELQVTVWGYHNDGFLGDVVFKRCRFLYKGTETTADSSLIDGMYVCHFIDVDLGSFSDDFSGCDSSISLGYVYNGAASDQEYSAFGLVPPSVGYRVVQGPLQLTGNPSDTAIFDFRRVPGAVNVPMTAFVYHASGGAYSDPPFNEAGGRQWYCMMKGLPPVPQPPPCPPPPIDPFTGQPATTSFWAYGSSDGVSAPDPGNPDGWTDGTTEGPGDRLIFPSTGPFSLALGDSQDIVYAVVGGLGEDNLNSVAVMKASSNDAKTAYDNLLNLPAPLVSVSTVLFNGPVATLTVTANANASEPSTVSAIIRRSDASIVTTEPLYDDGTHGDITPGDLIFTSMFTVNREAGPYHLDLSVMYPGDQSFTWEHLFEPITTVGFFTLSDFTLFSDNLNDDGEANPGENIRYGFTLSYSGVAPVTGVVMSPGDETDDRSKTYDFIPDGFVDSLTYDPNNPESYFSINIPDDFQDSILTIVVGTRDSLDNIWNDSLQVTVMQLQSPVKNAEIQHINGESTGSFSILVVDSAAVFDHTYVIDGLNEPGGFLGFTLRDSTDGRILLDHQEFPDEFGHNVPVTDGFKVMRGSIDSDGGLDTALVTAGDPTWTWILANGLQLEGYHGSIGSGWLSWFSGSTLPSSRASDVLIKFAPTDLNGDPLDPLDTLVSFAYRYLGNADQPPAHPEFAQYILNPDTGLAYQDFARTIPFAAYDMSGTTPRRLAVGHLENNVGLGLVDGKYWPGSFVNNTADIGPREWFFTFDIDYSETPDPSLQTDLENSALPIMWWGTPGRAGEIAFQQGDEFTIEAYSPYHSTDQWVFNPTIIVSVSDEVPLSYSVKQNYPNPFNPTTTILYSFPVTGRVTLRIYDLLGREVASLVDEVQQPGDHAALWDGRSAAGKRVASGVYFYRVQVSPVSGNGTSFVSVKKMILLR